jgi:hypothetical protein
VKDENKKEEKEVKEEKWILVFGLSFKIISEEFCSSIQKRY